MRAGTLASPVQMTDDEQQAVKLLGGSIGGVRDALNCLDGSILIRPYQNGEYVWRYKHPTIRDAFATLVAEDSELLDIYLIGTPMEKLFQEISCGDVGIQGVKVIIPHGRFDAVISRIMTMDFTKEGSRRNLHWFFAYRCNKEFLAKYIERYPQFTPTLRVSSYLYAVSDVEVIARLHEFGLLPEEKRLQVVAEIRELAVNIPDSGFLQKRFRHILSEGELTSILEYVRTVLLPNLDDHISGWLSNYDHDDDPDEYFSYLKDALEDYRKELVDFDDAQAQIDNALSHIDEVIEDLKTEKPEEPDYDDDYERGSSGSEDSVSRSVFDDVDS
jgi:hypothetical protein